MVQRYTPKPFAAVADTPEVIEVDPDYTFTTLGVYACDAQGGKLADYTAERGNFDIEYQTLTVPFWKTATGSPLNSNNPASVELKGNITKVRVTPRNGRGLSFSHFLIAASQNYTG